MAGTKGALEGIELTLQRIETGALGAARQLVAGALDGSREGLATILLPQGLHQLPHKVVDGRAVLFAIGILDTEPLEQALDGWGKALLLYGRLHGLGFATVAKQLAAQLEGDRGKGKQVADHDISPRQRPLMVLPRDVHKRGQHGDKTHRTD